jgi:hypothetical protein
MGTANLSRTEAVPKMQEPVLEPSQAETEMTSDGLDRFGRISDISSQRARHQAPCRLVGVINLVLEPTLTVRPVFVRS